MTKLTLADLFSEESIVDRRVGMASGKNIDKSGVVYHVITTSWRKKRLFDMDLAKYRQNLLCELCAKRGITIMFSATLSTHTHEVFITPDWEILSNVIRILNSNVAKYAKKHLGEKLEGWRSIFSPDPAYVLVDSLDYLFFLGKYVYENQQRLKEEGKPVPDSCFWMFEKNYFPEPYKADIYQKLFGMSPADLFSIYKNKTSAEVRLLSKQLFRDWTTEDNRRLFIRNR